MNKIMIDIYIPLTGQNCEFLVPLQMKVAEMKNLVLQIIHDEFGIQMKPDPVFLEERSQLILPEQDTMYALGLHDGTRLWLL